MEGFEHIGSDFIADNHIDKLLNSFSNVAELYSALVDINGNTIVAPQGPNAYLGEFYEMVHTPQFRSLYSDIMNNIVDSKQAMYSEVDDGNPDSRIAAAPIFVDGRFYAAWILYAHTKIQNQKLFKAFEHMSHTADALSEIITSLYHGSVAEDAESSMKTELDFEKNANEIYKNILEILSCGDKSNISELYESVGHLLGVDYIVYYKDDKKRPGYMKLVDYWSRTGKSAEAEEDFVWDNDHYDLELQSQIKSQGLVIDKKNMTNQIRVETFGGKVKAIMVFPVRILGEYTGRMIFIEKSRERTWSKAEIDFARQITEMVGRDLSIEKRIRRGRRGSMLMIDIFDSLPQSIIVREIETGRVLYANPSMTSSLGHDITGEDSFDLIPNVGEESEGTSESMLKSMFRGMMNYQRYIERLGGIYNIKEHTMRWKNNEKVSVIIMTPEE